ncbi:hypothetical protein ACHAWF_010090, partial [Thalassiosira exigua]
MTINSTMSLLSEDHLEEGGSSRGTSKGLKADKKETITIKQEQTMPMFSITFHVETLRIIGYINFVFLAFVSFMITHFYVNDYVKDPMTTTIYGMYGFNHACNWLDHNPSKLVAAILIPLVQWPLLLYIFFYHCRLYCAYTNGTVGRKLLWFSRIVSTFNFIVVGEIHLWFVNSPGEGYGFIAHYIPYALFQITFGLMAGEYASGIGSRQFWISMCTEALLKASVVS